MRFWIGFAAFSLLASAGIAAEDGRLLACRAIADDAGRLACYDQLADELAQDGQVAAGSSSGNGSQPEPAPAQSAVDVGPAAGDDTLFGKEHWTTSRDTPDTIAATVVAAQRTAYGRWVVQLENGQVWRQSDDERLRIEIGDRVAISRGQFSSFFFEFNGANRKLRFSRVE